jgi:diaminohydroxyphosphoribosylaminopyrimidine deaminase/5-amino-6-(5-phosphoribosylamino)uracil reductase
VNGRGIAILRRAGIEVTTGVLEAQAAALNERFLLAARARRPYVTLKAAATLDGRLATARGESKWITSPAQRRDARGLRRLHDGVVVGIGTVLADDPMLLPQPRVRRPFHRLVFDSRLRIPLGSRLVRSAKAAPVWVLTVATNARKRALLERRGVTVIQAPSAGPRVSLRWAMRELWRRGMRSLMVEGGSELLGAFVHARLLDAVALYRGPLLLGGRDGVPAFGGPTPTRLADALALSPVSPLQRRAGMGGRARTPLVELWYPVASR